MTADKVNPATENTIQLQGIGYVPAIKVKDLKPGMITVWNYGYTDEVLSVEPSKSGKTFTVKFKPKKSDLTTSDGRTFRANRLVGIKE